MNCRMYANPIDGSSAVQVIPLNYWNFIVCISVVSTYNLSLFESTGVLQRCLGEDGCVKMMMPWTFSVWSPCGITAACSWCAVQRCAVQQLSQTLTDGDLSFRLVAISCMQAFANRRNWQCWYLWRPIFNVAISQLGREQTCRCA